MSKRKQKDRPSVPLVAGEVLEFEAFIAVEDHADGPGVDEEQEGVALEVADALHVGGAGDLHGVDVAVDDPADVFVRQGLEDDVNVVFALEAEFEDVKLEHADNAAYDLFHAGVVFLEDLDGTFLGDLADALTNWSRFMVSTWRTRAKCSGAKVGMPS